MPRLIVFFALILAFTVLASAQDKRPLTYDDVIDMKRLDHVSVSPDGQWIAYNVREYSLKSNSYYSNIFIQSVDGKSLRQITSANKKDLHPVWSPDGKSIAFVSNRDGSYQLYVMPLDGGEPRRVSKISTDVSPGEFHWSPDGKYIVFTTDVYPHCEDDDCNSRLNDERETSKVKAQLIDKLPYRVWDSWKEGKRSQLILLDIATGKTTDLIKGDYDVPPIDLGGNSDIAFSPDGKTIAFTMNIEPNIAWSTNNDIFLLSVAGGEPKKISVSKGVDCQPIYSPDGKYIAFLSMKRAGYEADKKDLIVYETATGKMTNLTEKLDRSAGQVAWSRDSQILYFDADDLGYHTIYQVPLQGGIPMPLMKNKNYDALIAVADGKIIFKRQSMKMPYELYSVNYDGSGEIALTELNKELLSKLDMNDPEEFWFEGAQKTKVHGFLLKPPGFDSKRQYSAVFLIHGGPQGMWADSWHYRWNAQMFATKLQGGHPGHVVVMINPRGSTGYGQKFCDEINKDWGGKPYEDLMKGVDYVLAKYKFIDKKRLGAAGGSYGGYMVNWINGQTDRFRCMVSHSGIMNKFGMYGGTEELWFEEWEMGGPYWEGKNRDTYNKWSPYNYVQNFKTPTLVIHGELDFRVPVIEGIHLFTVLQRKGIDSKFLYYPDEGHFVAKPQNGKLWYQTVHSWFEKYLIPYEN